MLIDRPSSSEPARKRLTDWQPRSIAQLIRDEGFELYTGSIDPSPAYAIVASSSAERAFVPKSVRSVLPQHLKESISEKTLARFRKG